MTRRKRRKFTQEIKDDAVRLPRLLAAALALALLGRLPGGRGLRHGGGEAHVRSHEPGQRRSCVAAVRPRAGFTADCDELR